MYDEFNDEFNELIQIQVTQLLIEFLDEIDIMELFEKYDEHLLDEYYIM
jgi:hypothetical protein